MEEQSNPPLSYKLNALFTGAPRLTTSLLSTRLPAGEGGEVGFLTAKYLYASGKLKVLEDEDIADFHRRREVFYTHFYNWVTEQSALADERKAAETKEFSTSEKTEISER